ncbi:hypothetical protein J437_LFUL009623 [Ladona fulva]|uniref:Uncharacterized protein n=1 Tax=Ladona fulva TaxID=123851 RepID=A0A8K0P337_LADFU|nr:hypothetical protein J437_LFUL009623 [Ladona fulva]
MIGLREMCLSYRDTADRAGHTAMQVWDQCNYEGRAQRRAGTEPRNLTTARKDLHFGRMAVKDRIASSTVLAQRWGTAAGVNISVRRRLLRAALVACHCIGFH